jgi:hypothetical protein
MTESTELRWPQEAHPWPDQAQAYRQRAAERAQAVFESADWRENAVAHASTILERSIDAQMREEEFRSAPIVEALREANLIPTSEAPSDDPAALANNLVLGALTGEAAAVLLLRRADRGVWRAIQELVFNLDGMLQSLRAALQTIFQSDEEFRHRFDALADAIVSESLAHPAVTVDRRDLDTWSELIEDWRKTPDLRGVWAGVPRMRHTFYGSEVSVLAHIYVVLNPARLAQLLDRFDNPYQVWSVLTGFWNLGLDKKFSAWAAVFRHTQPSFRDDGSWTKRTLEPLLLVIAQDAIARARLRRDAEHELVAERQEELTALTAAISGIVADKPHGSSLALRWSAWLVRMTVGGASSNEEPYPRDLRQAVTPFWCMLQALARSRAAESWMNIPAPDASPEEILCLLSAKILAASEGRSAPPDVEPLFRCLPKKPQDFLGGDGAVTRELVRMYWSHGARPDALKYRILAFLCFKSDPVAFYRDFWRRTLTLRELAEHWQADDQNDGRMEAKETLAMVLAIGVNALDLYADARTANNSNFVRTSEQFGALFRLVYDALRELQAIELFNQPFWTNAYQHLLVRRALYENARVHDAIITVPLMPDAEPTLPTMLANIAGVTPIFFDGLESLIRNGTSVDSVAATLLLANIDLAMYVDDARRLNEIDERRPYRIDTADRITVKMKELNISTGAENRT